MLLQASTLQKIVTKNLLTVSIAQTQIASNFELIIQALTDHDTLLSQHTTKLEQLEKQFKEGEEAHKSFSMKSQQCQSKIQQEQDKSNKDIGELQQRMRKMQVDSGSLDMRANINPEADREQQEFVKMLKLIQERVTTAQGKIQKVEVKTAEIDLLAASLRKQQSRITNLGEEMAKLRNQLKSLHSQKQVSSFSNDRQLDQLKRLQDEIQALRIQLSTISSEVKRDINSIKDIHLVKLKEGQEHINKQQKKMTDELWKFNEQFYAHEKHSQQIEVAHGKSIDEILKRLKELEDLMDKIKSQQTTISNLSPQTIQTARPDVFVSVTPQLKKSKKDTEKGDSSDLKQEMLELMKQQRADLNKAIKKLDQTTQKKQLDHGKINNLEDQLLKLAHLLESKVDEDGLKKWMKYVDNQLKILYRIVNVEGGEEDAYIAKKNWFCLSCDRKLEPYRGRVGSHMPGGQVKGKTIDHEIIGGGMLFRNRSKFQLPHCKK